MEFKTKNILKIVNKYTFPMYIEENRKFVINELNSVFFPDKIAKFIDSSVDRSEDYLSIMIEYKNIYYNILAYKVKVRQRVERIRKLRKINASRSSKSE